MACTRQKVNESRRIPQALKEKENTRAAGRKQTRRDPRSRVKAAAPAGDGWEGAECKMAALISRQTSEEKQT